MGLNRVGRQGLEARSRSLNRTSYLPPSFGSSIAGRRSCARAGVCSDDFVRGFDVCRDMGVPVGSVDLQVRR